MTSAIMKIHDVTMDFRGLRALNQVQFDVEKGSITGIIGPNGAGKTTLFNVIAGKYKPTQGYVSFAGQEIAGLSPDKICRMGISRTYQSDRPFAGLSVINNVKVALLHGRGQAKRECRMRNVDCRSNNKNHLRSSILSSCRRTTSVPTISGFSRIERQGIAPLPRSPWSRTSSKS